MILREGLNVRALNTAATIWCSGAVDSLAGTGYSLEALVGACGVLFVHLGLRPIMRWIDERAKPTTDVETAYRLRIESVGDHDANIRQILMRHVNGHAKLTLQGIATDDEEGGRTLVVATIYSPNRNDRAMEEIVSRVSMEPEVKAVSWQKTAA